MSTANMTFEEMSESITGFDELAIEKHIGIDLYTDGQAKPVLMLRALVFVHLRRALNNDVEARKQVMEMTIKQVNGYFDAAPEDFNPEEPDSESGNAA